MWSDYLATIYAASYVKVKAKGESVDYARAYAVAYVKVKRIFAENKSVAWADAFASYYAEQREAAKRGSKERQENRMFLLMLMPLQKPSDYQ